MKSISTINDSDKLDKLMAEPINEPISNIFYSIKRNLMLTSFIGVLLGILRPKINSLSILGVHITLPDCASEWIYWCLVAILFYNLLHYISECALNFFYWRNRYTGSKLSHVTTGKFSHEGLDYPDNPKHSSLYRWWLENKNMAKELHDIHSDLLSFIQETEIKISELTKGNPSAHKPGEINSHIQKINNKSYEIAKNIKSINDVLSDERIKISLDRFERWFKKLLTLQSIKWIFFEFIIPIIFGLISLVILIIGFPDNS